MTYVDILDILLNLNSNSGYKVQVQGTTTHIFLVARYNKPEK